MLPEPGAWNDQPEWYCRAMTILHHAVQDGSQDRNSSEGGRTGRSVAPPPKGEGDAPAIVRGKTAEEMFLSMAGKGTRGSTPPRRRR